LGNGGFAGGLGALDGGVALGLGLRDVRLALDAGHVGPAHIDDVVLLVANLLDGERNDLQPHLREVVGNCLAHAAGHHLWLLDDLLDGEQTDDAAQVSFHHQANERLALLGRLGEELLGRGADALRIAFDLDLRYRLDVHRHALRGEEVLLRGDVEGHQLERELLGVLEHGPDDLAAAGDDAGAAPAVDDESAIGPHAPEEAADDPHQQDEDDYGSDDDDQGRLHRLALLCCCCAVYAPRSASFVAAPGGGSIELWPAAAQPALAQVPCPNGGAAEVEAVVLASSASQGWTLAMPRA